MRKKPVNTTWMRREKRHTSGQCALLQLCHRGEAGGQSGAHAGTLAPEGTLAPDSTMLQTYMTRMPRLQQGGK